MGAHPFPSFSAVPSGKEGFPWDFSAYEKRAVSHAVPSPRAVKPRAFKIQILGPLSATLKVFWFLSHPDIHTRTCFPDLGHATIPTGLGGNRTQLNLQSPAADLYSPARGGLQFLNGLIPSHPKNSPTLPLS